MRNLHCGKACANILVHSLPGESTGQSAGTVTIDTTRRKLYLSLGNGRAGSTTVVRVVSLKQVLIRSPSGRILGRHRMEKRHSPAMAASVADVISREGCNRDHPALPHTWAERDRAWCQGRSRTGMAHIEAATTVGRSTHAAASCTTERRRRAVMTT